MSAQVVQSYLNLKIQGDPKNWSQTSDARHFLTRAREWGPELRAREGGRAESAPCQLSFYEG